MELLSMDDPVFPMKALSFVEVYTLLLTFIIITGSLYLARVLWRLRVIGEAGRPSLIMMGFSVFFLLHGITYIMLLWEFFFPFLGEARTPIVRTLGAIGIMCIVVALQLMARQGGKGKG